MPGLHYNFSLPCKEAALEYQGPYIEDIVKTIRAGGTNAVKWSQHHMPLDKIIDIQALADGVASIDDPVQFLQYINTYACWYMISIGDQLEHPLDLYNVMEVFEQVINDNNGEIDEAYVMRKTRVSQERAKSVCEIISKMCIQDDGDKVCGRLPYFELNKAVFMTTSKLVDGIVYEPERNLSDFFALCFLLPSSFKNVPNIQWAGWKMNKARMLLSSDLGSSLLHMIFMYGTSNTYQKFYELLEQWIVDDNSNEGNYKAKVNDVKPLYSVEEIGVGANANYAICADCGRVLPKGRALCDECLAIRLRKYDTSGGNDMFKQSYDYFDDMH